MSQPVLRRSPRIAALKQAAQVTVNLDDASINVDYLLYAANIVNILDLYTYLDTLPDDSRNRMRALIHDMTLMKQSLVSWQINLGSEPVGFLTDLKEVTSRIYPCSHVQARMIDDGRYIVSVCCD